MAKVVQLVRNKGNQPPKCPASMLCRMGLHSKRWVRSFHTQLVNKRHEAVGHEESFRGFECTRCAKRILKEEKKRPAPGVTKEALAWLNEKN